MNPGRIYSREAPAEVGQRPGAAAGRQPGEVLPVGLPRPGETALKWQQQGLQERCPVGTVPLRPGCPRARRQALSLRTAMETVTSQRSPSSSLLS